MKSPDTRPGPPRRSGALLLATLIAPSAAAVTAPALGAPADDAGWHFMVQPYAWLPNLNANVDARVPGLLRPGADPREVSLSAEVDPNGYLNDLQLAAMFSAEARRERFVLVTDLIWADFSGERAHVRSVTGPLDRDRSVAREGSVDSSSLIWSLAAGYRVAATPAAQIDVLAGFRYLSLSNTLTVDVVDRSGRRDRQHGVSVDDEQWSGIVAVRGRLDLNPHWFVPWYADVGAGSGNSTWQAMVGLGYRFAWGDVTLALRSLSWNLDDPDADLRLTGPALGVAFAW